MIVVSELLFNLNFCDVVSVVNWWHWFCVSV